MKLIFTENTTMMALIASALSPIQINEKTYSFEEIQENLDIIKDISSGIIKTRMEGGPLLVARIPKYHLEKVNLSQEYPKIKFDEKFITSMEKYLKDNNITEISFALSAKFSSNIFIHLFMETFNKDDQIEFSFTRTDIVDKDSISTAVIHSLPKTYLNRFSAKARMQQGIIELVEEIIPGIPYISPTLLFALDMIKSRSEQHKGKKVKALCKIASRNIDIYSVGLIGNNVNLDKTPLRYINEISSTLPTMNILHESEIGEKSEEVAKLLYYKGYITNPDTLSSILPNNFNKEQIENLCELLSCCFSKDKLYFKDKLFDKKSPYPNMQEPLPILPLKKDLGPLSKDEKTLYNEILQSIGSCLEKDNKRQYYFSNEYNIFRYSLSTGKPALKVKHSDTNIAYYERISKVEEVPPYTEKTLLEDMITLRLIDVCSFSNILNVLVENNLIYKKDKYLIVTKKGKEICRKITEYKDCLIQLTIAANVGNSETVMFHDAYKKIQKSLKENKKEEEKIINPSLPSAKKEAENFILCPSCHKEKMIIRDHDYLCHECALTLPKNIPLSGKLVHLSEKDIEFLSSKQRTPIKKIKCDDGNELVGFITFVDNKLSFTNQTLQKCPVCGQPLYSFSWGYGCNGCNFAVPFILFGKELSSKDFLALVSGESTSLIDGLIRNDGTSFSARFTVVDGKISFLGGL